MATRSLQPLPSFTSNFSNATAFTKDTWQPNTENCVVCKKKFTLVLRRHHCRLCGQCVCNGCSPNKLRLDGHKRPQRVCMPCISGTVCPPLDSFPTMLGSANAASASTPPSLNASPRDKVDRGGLELPFTAKIDEDLGTDHIARGASDKGSASTAPEAEELEALSRRYEDARDERLKLEMFLVDFSHRLQEFVGTHSIVKTYSMTPKNRPSSDPAFFPPLDVDQAMADCEALCSPIADMAAQLPRLRQSLDDKNAQLRSSSEQAREAAEMRERMKASVASITRRLNALSCSDEQDDASLDVVEACESAIDRVEKYLSRPLPETRRSLTGSLDGQDSVTSGDGDLLRSSSGWEENTQACSICSAKFGKRNLTRRHHCRVCGKCVCSSCSPSSITVTSGCLPQRVCTPCVANAFVENLAAEQPQSAVPVH